MMSLSNFKKVVEELRNSLLRLTFAGYGEPFLNPNIYEMLIYAKQAGIWIEVYSNLLLLDEKGIQLLIDHRIDKLTVSIDAASEDTYSRHKKAGSFTETVKILKLIHEAKQKAKSELPHVKMSFVAMKHNVSEREKVGLLFKEVGADSLVFKSINLRMAGDDFEKSKEEWMAEDYDRYKNPPSGKSSCPWPYGSGLVYANGDIVPCCYDARGENIMGNVFTRPFTVVWNGERYKAFRKTLAKDPNKLPICFTCLARFEGRMG